MDTLKVYLFGSVRVEHTDQPVVPILTRTIQSLLAYLILFRERNHPRDVLAGLFWGDYSQSRARGCLNTSLWRLRQILEPGDTPRGTYLVTTPLGEVGFNRESAYWLDVANFNENTNAPLSKPVEQISDNDILHIKSAVDLYKGDLLEGVYDDWALREREHLRLVFLKDLACLMKYYGFHEQYDLGLFYGRQLLDLEPLDEEVHRALIHMYLQNGERALAIRQYETCREILEKELNIPPMEETRAVYAQILNAAHASGELESLPNIAAPANPKSVYEQGLGQLNLAFQTLDLARTQLQKALQYFERGR